MGDNHKLSYITNVCYPSSSVPPHKCNEIFLKKKVLLQSTDQQVKDLIVETGRKVC